MSQDSQPTIPAVDGALRQRYALYLNFAARFAREAERRAGCLSLAEFAEWWADLDDWSRRRWEHDFRRGYDAVLRAAEEEVAAVVEKYKSPEDQAGVQVRVIA
jgi:hypothetical protein